MKITLEQLQQHKDIISLLATAELFCLELDKANIKIDDRYIVIPRVRYEKILINIFHQSGSLSIVFHDNSTHGVIGFKKEKKGKFQIYRCEATAKSAETMYNAFSEYGGAIQI